MTIDDIIFQLKHGLASKDDYLFLLWTTENHPPDSYFMNGSQTVLAEEYGVDHAAMRRRICRVRRLGWIAIAKMGKGERHLLVNPSLFQPSQEHYEQHCREWTEAMEVREMVAA